MRITILTSCTGEKATFINRVSSHKDDFAKEEGHVARRTKGLHKLTRPAEKMYTGQHHTRLMRGVQAVQHAEGPMRLISGSSPPDTGLFPPIKR